MGVEMETPTFCLAERDVTKSAESRKKKLKKKHFQRAVIGTVIMVGFHSIRTHDIPLLIHLAVSS